MAIKKKKIRLTSRQLSLPIKLFNSFRAPSNDQIVGGFYDYSSFNNNYLMFQTPPNAYNNFDYPQSNPSPYHEYNSLPNYNQFASPATSPIYGSSYRPSIGSSASDVGKFQTQIKSENQQQTSSDSISIDKLQSIVHNTSEHVQELNQMCQIKETKEVEKCLASKLKLIVHFNCYGI